MRVPIFCTSSVAILLTAALVPPSSEAWARTGGGGQTRGVAKRRRSRRTRADDRPRAGEHDLSPRLDAIAR